MDFRLLGPLDVLEADRAIALGGGKQRSLLALLLLQANRVVSAERLIDALWDGVRPQSAENSLQTYVSRLRKSLGASRIVTQAPGYLIKVGPEELDLMRFERLAERGRSAFEAGEAQVALDLLQQALDLWRGSALLEFSFESFAQTEIVRLEASRLAALEYRIDSELALGRSVEVIAELESLTSLHPLRERLRGQLMLALYRTGRQADALEVYRKARALLVDELGINPSPLLQQLHTRILMQDPTLDLPVQREPVAATAVPPKPHAVRKTVTVLALDLSLAARLDPEVQARVLARARNEVCEALRLHGAFVSQPNGAGVMALFGVPALHEDDAARAVSAASRIHDLMPALNLATGSHHRTSVRLRIGIDTGEVLATGSELVDGSPVADACRLRDVAGHGEVLLSDATYASVGGVSAQRVPTLAAWRLRTPAFPAVAVERSFDTPLIGRDGELRQLLHAFDGAEARRICHLFTLLGPAGIGKSRLSHELAIALDGRAAALMGRCLPYGEGITLWPLAEIVKQAAGDTTPAAIEPLLGEEERASSIAQRVASALGVGEPDAEGEETFWAFRRLVEALARRRPLLIVVEDIHWAETTLLDFVEYLADTSRGAPILLLCLARPELLDNRPSWAGGKYNATSVLLEGLSRPDADLLIASLSERLGLESLDRGRVADVAEGNPLFIEQILALAGDNSSAEELTIPSTIQSLLAARLDRLPVPERCVVERASIIGREFGVSALAHLSPEDEREELPGLLDELARKELIRPIASRAENEDSVRFRHILIRDTAYESVPKQTRAELHARFADWVEQTAGDRASELDEIVGYHLEQAYRYRVELQGIDDETLDLAARAADRLGAAGERARSRTDISTASVLLRRAADVVPESSALQGDILVALAYAERDAGRWEPAQAAVNHALLTARAQEDTTLELRLRISQLQQRLFTDKRFSTDEMIKETSETLDALDSRDEQRFAASAKATLAWAYLLKGRAAEAERLLLEIVALGRRESDETIVAHAQKLIVSAWAYGPMPVASAIKRCEDLLEEEPGMRVAAQAYRSLALLNAMQGRFVDARVFLAREDELLAQVGSPLISAAVQETRGAVELLAGDAVAAEAVLSSALISLRRFQENLWRAPVAAVLSEAMFQQGRHEEAMALSIEIEGTAPRDVAIAVAWRAVRARVLATRGDGAATTLAREAVAMTESTDSLDLQGDALLSLAETLAASSDCEVALEMSARALERFSTKGNVVLAGRARQKAESFS